MNPYTPRRVVVRNAWWAVTACVACLVIYILGCVMSRPSWSPDSTRLALLVTPPGNEPNLGAIFTYDVRTGECRCLDRVSQDGLLSGPAWSPDGHWIAYYRVEPSAGPNVPASSNAEPNRATAGPSGVPMLEPFAAGESILPGMLRDLAQEQVGEKADRVAVKLMMASADGPDKKTACVIQWLAQRKDVASLMVMNPVWSKDSRRLFLAGGMDSLFSIMQFDLQTGQVQTLLLSSTGSAAVSPDGQWVATLLSRSSNQADLAVAKVDGQMTRYLKLALDQEKVDESDLALLSAVSWAPDAKRVLVSLGKQMLVANVETGEGRLYRDPETEDVAWGSLTPAGDAVIYLAGLKKEDSSPGQQAVQLKTLSLSNGKSRTLVRLPEGLNLKSSGAFSMAPSGRAAALRCTTEDAAGKERSLLILWDGKTTKTVETDPWLQSLP